MSIFNVDLIFNYVSATDMFSKFRLVSKEWGQKSLSFLERNTGKSLDIKNKFFIKFVKKYPNLYITKFVYSCGECNYGGKRECIYSIYTLEDMLTSSLFCFKDEEEFDYVVKSFSKVRGIVIHSSHLRTVKFLEHTYSVSVSCPDNYIEMDNLFNSKDTQEISVTFASFIDDQINISDKKYVSISVCFSIINTDNFHNINELNFDIFPELDDISSLSTMKTLNTISFSNCNKIKDLKPISHVKHVYFTNCKGIFEIKPVAKADIIVIDNCENIWDLSTLKDSKNLTISSKSLVETWYLGDIENLSLIECENIKDIQFLNNKKLTIFDCDNLEILQSFDKIKELQTNNKDIINIVEFMNLTGICNYTKLIRD